MARGAEYGEEKDEKKRESGIKPLELVRAEV
jgi:hypothetical protein